MEKFGTDVWTPVFVKLQCAYFQRSPDWNGLLQSVHMKYESVNSVHQEAGATRLPWQDEVEKQLRGFQKLQRFWLHDAEPQVEGVLWGAASLSTQLDMAEGVDPLAYERSLLGWKATLKSWEKFRRLMRDQDGGGFRRCLTSTQKLSYEVLEDWWRSSHADQTLVEHARSHIESLQDVACFSSPLGLDELQKMAQETRIDESLYHASCYALFLGEFHPMCWEPFLARTSLTKIQELRVQASQLSICQRMAWATICKWQMPAPRQSDKGYPSPIRDTKLWFDGFTFEEKPYYLWDSLVQCTVQVGVLSDCPEYTCVSHTWGRWRKSKTADVPGTEWAIPENELYDVRQLPDMLKKLGETGVTRYVWFDLFCIPQIDGDERQQIEISRQSAIFRNCKRYVAWINHCDSFVGVGISLDWLALRFLRPTVRYRENKQNAEWLDSCLREFDSLGWLDIELMQSRPNQPDTSFGPVGWLTSLWTLQEAVLCPDLEQCAQDWTTLVDGQEDDEIKMDEVGRQVSIFRDAATPFVWLCHISINEFYEAIELLASETWKLFRERQHTEQTGLIRQPAVLQALEGIEMAVAKFLRGPWFSSLWTLQEFMLRLDAVVLDRYGESLTVLREDLALLVKSQDRQDDLLTLEALCWALHSAQAEGRELQQRRHLLQDKGEAAGPHILELISRIYRTIQECGCGTDWLHGPSNPNIQYSAAKFRKTTHREDRIYAISQIYNFRVGQSARPMDRPSLEHLIEELGLAINTRSPLLGQLFVHNKQPEVGRSWCITEHSDVPEIGDVPALVRLTSTIARDESGFVVAHGPSCTFEDLCNFWKFTPDYPQTNHIHLDEHFRQLVDPANIMSPSDTEGYMSQVLAHFRLLGDYGRRFRTTSEMIDGYEFLL